MLPFCLDWCGSVGWASVCKAKGRRFDFWSGHMLGCRFCLSPLSGHIMQPIDVSLSHGCVFPSLSPSLPLSNQEIKSFKNCYIFTSVNRHVCSTLFPLSLAARTGRARGSLVLAVLPCSQACPSSVYYRSPPAIQKDLCKYVSQDGIPLPRSLCTLPLGPEDSQNSWPQSRMSCLSLLLL